MKMASRKNEIASRENPSPNTDPKVAVKFGQSRPSSKLRIVPVTTPPAKSASMIFDQRLASTPYSGSPVRCPSHSTKTTIAGKEMPKQTSGMCAANESACICRAWCRYPWLTWPNTPDATASITTDSTSAQRSCGKRSRGCCREAHDRQDGERDRDCEREH